MAEKNISVTLKIWRQRASSEPCQFETHQVKNVSTGSSFLVLDVLTKSFRRKGKSLSLLTMTAAKEFAECVRW